MPKRISHQIKCIGGRTHSESASTPATDRPTQPLLWPRLQRRTQKNKEGKSRSKGEEQFICLHSLGVQVPQHEQPDSAAAAVVDGTSAHVCRRRWSWRREPSASVARPASSRGQPSPAASWPDPLAWPSTRASATGSAGQRLWQSATTTMMKVTQQKQLWSAAVAGPGRATARCPVRVA